MEKSRISTSKILKLLNQYQHRAALLIEAVEAGMLDGFKEDIPDYKTYTYSIAYTTIDLIDAIKKELEIE